jgi:hypothetical protein
MLLQDRAGQPFATGVTTYLYQPASGDFTNRIVLQVSIGDVLTEAIVDTGSPYVVCPPRIAREIGLDSSAALDVANLKIRGFTLKGELHHLNVLFHAVEGEPLMVEATVFVPDDQHTQTYGDLPGYIGFMGCLERMRFAVDPEEDRFYFAGLGES